jgi:hypothetical protein
VPPVPAGPPAALTSAALYGAPSVQATLGRLPGVGRGVRTTYSPGARSPVLAALLTMAMHAAALGTAVGMSASMEGRDDPRTSTVVWLLVLCVAASCCLGGWLWRIGHNGGQFGGGTVVGALIPWACPWLWAAAASNDIGLKRLFVALAMLTVLVVVAFPWRRLIFGLWRAAGLTGSILPALGWVAALVGTQFYFGSILLALSKAEVSYSRYTDLHNGYVRTWVEQYVHDIPDPNRFLMDGGSLLIVGGVFIFTVVAIAATVAQHVGIQRDRKLLREAVAHA